MVCPQVSGPVHETQEEEHVWWRWLSVATTIYVLTVQTASLSLRGVGSRAQRLVFLTVVIRRVWETLYEITHLNLDEWK